MTFKEWWEFKANWHMFKQTEDVVTYNIIYHLCKEAYEGGKNEATKN